MIQFGRGPQGILTYLHSYSRQGRRLRGVAARMKAPPPARNHHKEDAGNGGRRQSLIVHLPCRFTDEPDIGGVLRGSSVPLAAGLQGVCR